MARYVQPFPGQTLAKTYSTQWAYQRDANTLAIQGWSVQSTTMHDVGRRYKRPEVLVTYVYRPMMVNASAPQPFQPVNTSAPLSPPTVSAPPPGAWAWTPAAPPPPPLPLYQFPIWEAIVVAVLMVGGFALAGAGEGAGAFLMLVGIIWAVVRDGRGLRSMRNLINWEAMSGGGKTLLILGILFLGLWVFVLPIYLVRMLIDSFRSQRDAALSAPLLVKQRTAELESQLGIVPDVQGECRKCQKPLQVGAEYCAYCGEPVVLRPRICPVCASTALPDAKFCPKCRAELPPAV